MGDEEMLASIRAMIEKLEGSTITIRNQGLEGLRRIFGRSRSSSRSSTLSDDSIHIILESLFRIVRSEKAKYAGAATGKSQDNSEKRMEDAAKVLLIIVDDVVGRLKQKTANAVLDHIVDMLPDVDGGLFSPIETKYLKCFNTLLSHAPIGEHLRHKQWQLYTDFVLATLEERIQQTDDREVPSSMSLSASIRNGSSMALRLSQSSSGRTTQQAVSGQRDPLLKELLTALKYLTSITNAPLITSYKPIIHTMVQVLGVIQWLEELAFEILSQVLPIALSEDISLTTKTCDDICRIVYQRDLWTRRSAVLKENILTFMIMCRPLFLSIPNPPLLNSVVMKQLFEVMQSDYENSVEKDWLQIDDLAFTNLENGLPWSLNGIDLAVEKVTTSDGTRVINSWACLRVMAYLLVGVAKRRLTIEHDNEEETVKKRQKLLDPVEDLFHTVTGSGGSNQLVALQLSLFVIDVQNSITSEAANMISKMQLTDLEDEPTMTSWTCLLLARITCLQPEEHNLKSEFWRKVWFWAARASGAIATSRSACYLLYCLTRSRIIHPQMSGQQMCDSVFPDGTNGPALLTDTALLLLVETLRSGMLDNEKSFKAFSAYSIRWLDHQWIVSDRLQNVQTAIFARSDSLLSLLMSAAGVCINLRNSRLLAPTSNVYKAAMVTSEDFSFSRYMLSNASPWNPKLGRTNIALPVYLPSTATLSSLRKTVVDMVGNKIKSFYLACKASMEEGSSSVSFDMIEIATTACVLYHASLDLLEEMDRPNVQAMVRSIWDIICAYLERHRKTDFWKHFSKVAARVTSVQTNNTSDQTNSSKSHSDLSKSLVDVLKQRPEVHGNKDIPEDDMMETSNLRTSLGDVRKSFHNVSDAMRSDLTLLHSEQTVIARQRLLLEFDVIDAEGQEGIGAGHGTHVVDAITSLDARELLATRDVLTDFLDDDPTLTREDSARLLTKLAKICLQEPNLERCEAALCLCLRVATRLAPMWTLDHDDELGNVGYDIYQWFIEIALQKSIASPRVLLSIAALLNQILCYNSTYGTESLPSARTSLLQILQSGSNALKFRLTDFTSNLFNGYVLSEHPAVFNDIIDSLPSDPDRKEGIFLRLFIIANLGAQWHTILRQSIYHIFETAAEVPSTIAIATKCVDMVRQKLELDSPKQLLKLFSPQVFYTWLERQGMESIPFHAFGYDTLSALQADVQDELIPQIAMRASTEHAQDVVRCFGTSWDSLIELWFAKVVAYAILTDIAINRPSREIGKAEMGLVQQLGEERYARNCRTSLAEAISTIFLRLSDDRGFEKILDQNEGAQKYVIVYRLICSHSSSQMQLPPGQQPSFRAKHLLQILDRMCMRAQETLESLWTPALLVHVYRALLADAKPAFGPLHTCAVLRKIRAVICLAGSVALSGYPLQMLLHALRPFLTQFHSSEDAFGIFWYLLEHGKEYLKQKLPFITGLSVAIFASLSRFASSSQDSTTQESHFASTMSKAQDFRLWLGKYLQEFSVSQMNEATGATFNSIVQAAKQITKAGNSAMATAEGSLLYHLLEDQASEPPLLPDTFFQLTLRSLCEDFSAATDFQDDILYDDKDVLRIAPVLWTTLDHQRLRDSFRIWVLQALGRAYALQGPSITELRSHRRSSARLLHKSDLVIEDSYQSIVSILGDLLWDEDETFAGAAEATLQSIFSALPIETKSVVLGPAIDSSMFDELRFVELPCPSIRSELTEDDGHAEDKLSDLDGDLWAAEIVKKLSKQQKSDPVLTFLSVLINLVPSLASSILPYVTHLALNFEIDKQPKTRGFLTEAIEQIFNAEKSFSNTHIRLALKTITYLRGCIIPSESTMAKRNMWLGVDFGVAAAAALKCKMYRTALLMLEIHTSQYTLAARRSNRKSSLEELSNIPTLLNQIYQNIDDPDVFYGTHEESDIPSIVEKLCHEGHGYKALSFQSAMLDSNIRTGGMSFALNTSGVTTISALNLANLNGLSNSIGSFMGNGYYENSHEHGLQSILNLRQWDIAQERSISDHGSTIVNALRTLSTASQKLSIMSSTDQSTLELSQLMFGNKHQRMQRINCWTSLAVLAELKEMLSVSGSEDLDALLQKRSVRRAWTEQESFDCIEPLLLGREAAFATIKNNPQTRSLWKVTVPQAMLLEIKTLRASLSLGHVHEMSQFCLNRAAYLSHLLPSATQLGVRAEAAIQYDLANTFWAQHETAASIRILQDLHEKELPDQVIKVQQSEILTDLGSKISEARLDRPDEVTARYLVPAINALGEETMGSKVGRVFHNFAAFCDSQLRDPDNVEEYERIEKIRDRKSQEVLELQKMYEKGDSKTRDTIKAHFSKAKTWLKLDDEELKRLIAHRETLVRNCLENYLLSLRACHDFPNDVLRFLALWMEQSNSPPANTSVSKFLSSVPTYKFAPLMNQLSSRILSEESPFQHLLSDLMYHICEDHPFHSLNQVFATSKSKGAQKDEVANSRHRAATKLSDKIMKKSSASNLWISIHNSNIQFVRVAQEKFADKELKTGSKLLLRKLPQGAKLEQTIHDMHYKIPAPTMKIEIRPDKNYSSTPTIAKFDHQISIAGGISAPKIITIIDTNGSRHKMLLKGGNDDLRQDSIMEQVFEQVSNLLKDHRPTRQRKLGIRTYKVIPLTQNSGIIEFVRNTTPLHDYLLPAHTRYYPKDYKPNKCRKDILEAQSKSLNQRLQTFRNVVSNFHPVMRFFFMEHFLDPDDWFEKRLNYSRSTAAISMLGHVLGLGDRHGHNILLDTKTGEVVHIDLGVAFEAGRVLPVPEVVPFRLTRDLVDGMGLSGVEGVFRRCCNFTLEALRRNQEAIMTILDVLRWDPLYSWSVSPLRLARMQENQEQAANADPTTTGKGDLGASTTSSVNEATKRNANEPSEADRALAVVSKKLGKSLSVEATVNELIRQAMDERNLAVLYFGWAAYA